jgi:HEAT repeat protein
MFAIMIILMNQTSVTPAPHILVQLLSASDSSARATAAQFLLQMLQSDDPILRWGTVTYLLHTPMRYYLDALVERLQEEDQPLTVRLCARRLKMTNLSVTPPSHAAILDQYARLRFLLLHTADLYHRPQSNG